MNRPLLSITLLTVVLLILGACTSAEPPTQEVTQAAPSVKIGSSQEGKVLELTLDGYQKTIVLWADATPTNVSFSWERTGSGSLTSDTDASIQYVSPQSVDGEEEVVVKVTVTDPATNLTASDRTVIRLLPSAFVATAPDTPVPDSEALQLDPVDFVVQSVPNGEEFLLDTRFGAVPVLPHDDGVDLGAYILEFTFEGGDGKEAQLFFKDSAWANVYSKQKRITSGQAIRFDPAGDPRDVGDFDDFAHIYAVGVKIWGGSQGVEIVSARLIRRDTSISSVPVTVPSPSDQAPAPSPSAPAPGSEVSEEALSLRPADFVVQEEEFLLDTRFGAVPILPHDDGVDLSAYVLEFTFQGGGGKNVQLFFKDSTWANVYSKQKRITSGQAIRFDPASDPRDVGDFDDFTHIYAVGAKIAGGVQGVEIASARLIRRDTSTSSVPVTVPSPSDQAPAPSPSAPAPGAEVSEEALSLQPADFVVQGGEFFLDTCYGAVPVLPHDDGVDLSAYVLEFTFQGGDGKNVQLFFKDSAWANVYSRQKRITSGQAIRFDPASDPRDVDEFGDFTRIYAVGAKIWGGGQGVEIASARLIRR